MPVNIQLAVQGGGAKICLLLAAFEAIQQLEQENVIRVKKIAGTSAGAIAACMFAARIPMSEIRNRLRDGHGSQLANGFRIPSAKGKIFGEMRATFQWLEMIKALAGGRPLWDTAILDGKLRELFEAHGKQRLDQLDIPVTVVATDLGNSAAKPYRGGDQIIDALMASAGLPYCFRTWDKNGAPHHVDGGLCENLPIGELRVCRT